MSYNVYALDKNGKAIFGKDGKPDLSNADLYVSVSQILSVEGAGDFLNRWLLDNFNDYQEYKQHMNKVSDLGTRIHTFMEYHLSGRKYPHDLTADMIPAIESYLDWYDANEVEVIDVERILFSRKIRTAGTRDAFLRINGKKAMVDLKTGSVYSKAFVQLAAYHLMASHMGEDVSDVDLVVLGGKDSKSKLVDGGQMIMHTREGWFGGDMSIEDLQFYFGCLRQIWFFQNMKSKKFQPVIKGMSEYVDTMVGRFREQFFLPDMARSELHPVNKEKPAKQHKTNNAKKGNNV